MSISLTPPCCQVERSPSPCCCPNENRDAERQRQIDLICRVAVGIFAAVISPTYMVVSSILGLVAGGIYAASRLVHHLPMYPDGTSKPVCAQGYMDFLAGMRFPPVIGTVATTAFIVAHMRHDVQFYVPFCGFFIGFWGGREVVKHLF